jgi:hypothetical protein
MNKREEGVVAINNDGVRFGFLKRGRLGKRKTNRDDDQKSSKVIFASWILNVHDD